VKLSEDTVKLLRQTLRGRSRVELKRLFAAIRANEDPALLAALAPAKKRAAKRNADPLVRELEQTLKPILGPASEKADLLVEHLAKKHRRKLTIQAKGLADAARQLRAKNLTDDHIRAGAKSLIVHLAKLYGGSETVV
jgi:cell division septum initiation protein DivIVA